MLICDVTTLMDRWKFLCAGADLIGLPVTNAFMSMLLDHTVTPGMLLMILPKQYEDLKTTQSLYAR